MAVCVCVPCPPRVHSELVADVGDSRCTGRASGTTPIASNPRFGRILGRSRPSRWSTRSKNHAASSEACCRLSSRGCACISSQIIQSLGSAVASKSRNQRRSMVRTSLYLNFLRWGSIQRFWGYRQFSSELRASTHEATWPRQALSPLILSSAHQFAVLTTEG